MIVVGAGTPSIRNGDVFHPFRASSDFVWLTGAAEPDAVLVMTPDAESPGGHSSTLYLRVSASRHESEQFYRDRNYGELWTGRRPGIAETQAALGLTTRPLGELDGVLHALSTAGAPVADDALVATTLSDLRLVKDDWEIAQLSDAVAASVHGFEDVVRELGNARSTSERWVEGTFGRRARVEGNDIGYGSVAAAGEHACILHWTRNDGPVRDGDLLLLDAGVENTALYTADVTRTIPISGRFSEPQRRVYQARIRRADGGDECGQTRRAFPRLFPRRKRGPGERPCGVGNSARRVRKILTDRTPICTAVTRCTVPDTCSASTSTTARKHGRRTTTRACYKRDTC